MSKQNVLDLDKILKDKGKTLVWLQKEILKEGIKVDYHTLQNYKGSGAGKPPRAIELINVMCRILNVDPNELLK